MVSKTQPVIPPSPPIHLETIYEESGSSLTSSIDDVHHQSHNRQKSSTYSANQTTHGLISARSIPSVDVHRRKEANEYQQKLPIEVRYRDGTRRYIHPSSTTAPMVINRRKYSHSSRHDSSLSTKINTKYRQIFNTTPKKKRKLPKKPAIVLTIITAEDLSQAGITPPSTSSPDESDTLTLTKSQSNSSLDTITTVKDISLKDIDEGRWPIATIPPSIQPVQPVIDVMVSNVRFLAPPRHRSQHQQQLRHPQQMPTIRSQSLPPAQSHILPSTQQKSLANQVPPVAVIPPNPKKSLPSLQITLKNDENKQKSSSKVKQPKTTTSSSKSTIETTNNEYKHPFRPSANVLVGGGSRSAFRPFLKSTTLNSQPRIPLNINVNSQISRHQSKQNSSQQQQIFLPSHPHLQQFRPTSLSSMTRFTIQPSSTTNPVVHNRRSSSSDAPKQPVNSIIKNQIKSDKVMNSTSNYPQQSVQISTNNIVDNSFNKTNETKVQTKDAKSHLITLDPNLKWHSVTSKSLYDVPRLSNKYSDIPLRIIIPDGTPTHNQKLLYKHDIALEKRLLEAGLSPETIALYERILEVADVRSMDIISPPEIIDQYPHKSLL